VFSKPLRILWTFVVGVVQKLMVGPSLLHINQIVKPLSLFSNFGPFKIHILMGLTKKILFVVWSVGKEAKLIYQSQPCLT
jgi:hypothetical protein